MGPQKFRKKPVVIEAIQVRTDNAKEVIKFLKKEGYIQYSDKIPYFMIHTMEGDMLAGLDDWIIKGTMGEYYPCKPKIFEQTYDEVQQ